MKLSIIDDLKSQEPRASMIGRTLRLPPDIDKEINEFCQETGVARSVLYRRIVAEGWRVLNAEDDE